MAVDQEPVEEEVEATVENAAPAPVHVRAKVPKRPRVPTPDAADTLADQGVCFLFSPTFLPDFHSAFSFHSCLRV